MDPGFSIKDHIGRSAQVQSCLLDEQGHVYLQTDTGFGRVHTQDMGYVADAVEQGWWLPQEVRAADLPLQFSYVMNPKSLQKIELLT